MLTGRSKLKRRLLDLTGWEVVYIDYRDWDSATDKVDCVFKAFAKHGVDPQVAQRDAHLTRALPEAESSAILCNRGGTPNTRSCRPSRRATARLRRGLHAGGRRGAGAPGLRRVVASPHGVASLAVPAPVGQPRAAAAVDADCGFRQRQQRLARGDVPACATRGRIRDALEMPSSSRKARYEP